MAATADDPNDMWRFLAEKEEIPTWKPVVVSVTLGIMFLYMMMDWIGPDWVMITGLAVFLATEIVEPSAKEGLRGFSNEGILTVVALFVVAEGLSRTGLLDYYMGLVLGKPRTVAGAQIRLMVPIAILSAFLNNTPIVAVAIPIVLRWSKIIQVPRQQLLIPLSYATILGGTCTLVGTSTNLVVNDALKGDYPNQPAGNIGLFDLAIYGVPNAIIGIIYMMLFSPFLLPKGRRGRAEDGVNPADVDDLLLGARVMPWSPAAGRTVKRSGLSDAGGIYLVNVKRHATGNLQYAVSRDFVLSVGDELYFTGQIEHFSEFCAKHGLAIITADGDSHHHYATLKKDKDQRSSQRLSGLSRSKVDSQMGLTNVATFQSDEAERLRAVNRLMDQIEERIPYKNESKSTRVIVTRDVAHVATDISGDDNTNSSGAVIVAVDTIDRPGLMSQISDVIFEQGSRVGVV